MNIHDIRNSVLVPYHHAQAFFAANHYDYPASAMTVIGVTGTNGKTSTCFMIYHTLKKAGFKVGMLTTIGMAMGDEIEKKPGHMTTDSPKTLNKHIATMREAGIQYLVLEVSSHALAQGRVLGIPFDIVVMTNVTPEHLDYHRTFERYRAAKMKLFRLCADEAKRGGRGIGVVNADDPSGKYFAHLVPKPISYGVKDSQADLRATRIKVTTGGVEYYTRIDKEAYHIKVNLAGEFYVYNSLAAVAVCHSLGLSREQIEAGLADLSGVEGRMEHVETGRGFDVIVDYAHTPDSYRQMLPALQKVTKGRIFLITGAEGHRDPGKFAPMGEAAGQYADEVILTELDCMDEDVRDLSEKIAVGVRKTGKTEGHGLTFIDDRQEAITHAIKEAQKGDLVLLLGVGHQKTLERADGQHPWSEREAVEKALEATK